MLSQNLVQRQEQKLVMTRQMIQSIEMLQLPLMDLMQNINQELVANPWLEQRDGDAGAEGSAEMSGAQKAVEEKKAAEAANETDARVKRLESLMREWNDPNTRSSSGMVRRAGEDDAKMEAMQN